MPLRILSSLILLGSAMAAHASTACSDTLLGLSDSLSVSDNVTWTGTMRLTSATPPCALPMLPGFPAASSTTQTITWGATGSIDTSFHGSVLVHSGSTLLIKPGSYRIGALTLEWGATLRVDTTGISKSATHPRLDIVAKDSVQFMDGVVTTYPGLSDSLAASRIGLYLPGAQRAIIGNGVTLRMSLLDPQGWVVLGDRTQLWGRVLAHRVQWGNGSKGVFAAASAWPSWHVDGTVLISGTRRFWTDLHSVAVAWTVGGVAQTTGTTETFATEGSHWIKRTSGSNSDSVLALVDWTAPVVVISSPADQSQTNKVKVAVLWSIDGVSQSDSSSLQVGSNSLTRAATDSAGNTGSATVTVTRDTVAPVVAILSPTNGTWTNNATVTVRWSVDGVEQTPSTQTLSEGLNTITRSSSNAAGNTGSASVQIHLDTQAPVVVITSPANGITVRTSSVAVTWSVDGVSRTDTATLVTGTNTITRSLTDSAGNTGSASILVYFTLSGGSGLVAVAKAPDTAFTYTEVEISGASSTAAKGVRKIYSLRQIGGDSVRITPQGPFFAVLARDSGTLRFELAVADSQGDSAKDTVSILVREPVGLIDQLDLLQDQKSAQEGAAGITITSPTRDASQAVLDSLAFLQGFVSPATPLGQIRWRTDRGHSGTFQPALENWTGLNVPLERGDNFITLIYQDSAGDRAADRILVTRTDSAFAWNLALSPDTFQVGTAVQVQVRANVQGIGLERVEFVNLDRAVESLTDLNDDGTGQDSVAQDALYSGVFNRIPATGERYRFRVKMTTDGGVYWSKVYFRALVQPITTAHSDSVNSVQAAAVEVYTAAKAALGKVAAMDSLVTWLGQQPVVELAGVSPDSQAVSWISTEGIYCLLPDAPEGTRGGQIHTKALSPYYYDILNFSAFDEGKHVTDEIFKPVAHTEPTLWDIDSVKANLSINDNQTSVYDWGDWNDYRAIVVATHGNTFGFDWNQNFYAGDPGVARKSRFKKPFVVQLTKDLALNGVIKYPGLESYAPNVMPYVVRAGSSYAVAPRYLHENSQMGEFVFWGGFCRSAYDRTVWNALRSGAGKNQAYFGFDDYVSGRFSGNAAKIVFSALVSGKTAQLAYDSVVTFCGSSQSAGICGVSNGVPYDLGGSIPARLKLFGDLNFRLVDRRVMAAGSNSYGQLGDSSFLSSDTLVRVRGFEYGKTVAAGANTSYALAQNGRVYSWGRDSLEELGNGPGGTAQSAPVVVVRRNSGVTVTDTLSRIADLVGSQIGTVSDSWKSGHALALDSSGFVYAWGANNSGQLGTGLYGIATSRARKCTTLTNIKGIAAGRTFSLAVDGSGIVWSWGKNVNHVLGIGNLATLDSIQPVPGNVRTTGGDELDNVVAVAAGDLTSFAIRRDGTVWSWGSNYGGEMGVSQSTIATSTGFATKAGRLSGQGIQKIRLGEDHGLGLDAQGRVWSWGTNTNGQLGNGSVGGIELPALVPGISTKIVDIAAGAAFSVALDEHGAVYVWGSNARGQLGLGDQADRATPYLLVGGGIRKIAAGNSHVVLMK